MLLILFSWKILDDLYQIKMLFWKQQRNNEAHSPIGPAIGLLGIITRTERKLHRLITQLNLLTNYSIDWHYPLAVLPVVSRLRTH